MVVTLLLTAPAGTVEQPPPIPTLAAFPWVGFPKSTMLSFGFLEEGHLVLQVSFFFFLLYIMLFLWHLFLLLLRDISNISILLYHRGNNVYLYLIIIIYMHFINFLYFSCMCACFYKIHYFLFIFPSLFHFLYMHAYIHIHVCCLIWDGDGTEDEAWRFVI